MSGKSQKKQLAILIVLLALLSISLFSQLSRQDHSPVSASSKNAPANYAAKASSNEKLEVDLLSEEHPEFSGVKRNIFQFGRGIANTNLTPEGLGTVTPSPQAPPQPPPLPEVHYLGFYYEKESGLKMAALSNNGRIMVGQIGQVLGSGRFQVLEIAADHVVLKLPADEGKMIRVPLGKAPASLIEGTEEQSE